MTDPNPTAILHRLLARFAFWLRWWSALRGLAQWLLLAVAVAGVSFAIDYFLEPNFSVRTILLAAFGAALLFFLIRWVLSPFFVRWSHSSIAAAVERRVPGLNERLLTAVELGEFPPAPSLLERVQREAADLAKELAPTSLFSIRPTLRVILAAFVVLGAAATAAVAFSDQSRTWWRRVALLESIRYPRQTMVVVEGFRNGVRRVARGKDVEIVVVTTGRSPERATFHFLGARAATLRRQVIAASADGAFRHRIRSVVEPVEFTVQAGDDRTDVLRLEPVVPPGVLRAEIATTPPSYTGMEPATVSWTTGAVSAPAGSQIAFRLTFDRPTPTAEADLNGKSMQVDRPTETAAVVQWESAANRRLTIHYADSDGVEGDEPFQVEVVAVADKPPYFEKFEPFYVGPAVTRLAALPVDLKLIDDYGVEQLAFVMTPPGRKPVRISAAAPPTFTTGARPFVELGPFGFKEGDKFTLSMEASDLPPPDPFLGVQWNESWSNRTVRTPALAFEVVSADDLQARLAAREINFRQRFEQTLRECRDVKRTLTEAVQSKDAAGPLQKLRIDEALQAIRKSANETRELSAAFFGLVEEFRNNRVGASGMLERLERSVAEPLRKLAQDSFELRIREIQSAAAALGGPTFPAKTEQAVQGIDVLLREGEAVLAAMRKMENFNELVSQLRSLRDEQQKLLQETKEERKRRILDLVK